MNPNLSRAAVLAAHVFERKGWTWSVRDGKSVAPYVPNAAEIAEVFQSHVRSLRDQTCSASASGRLMVSRGEFGERELYLSLGTLEHEDEPV